MYGVRGALFSPVGRHGMFMTSGCGRTLSRPYDVMVDCAAVSVEKKAVGGGNNDQSS
ncbi:hypothetical protein ATK86_5418 [Nocardia fluminea]|uniref:Uncharacterized protein n=1 Tax=Nocardia fluminea TaxID=134984 RepID=A0A2N3VH72_9NOCA|nr:hypothetical protein ATK86_5418 [Nocardia fluminea]